MPPRQHSQLSKSSFHPSNDPATYRDLLFFEERLKTNATNLQRRKSRYQLFLAQLILVIAFLLSEVLLQTAFLDIPYTYILRKAFPKIYAVGTAKPHPYFASGLLFVSVTALLLFFASGMYSEKIAYANRYVPHANKALRNFNMYLNVRRPPLRSKLSFNPLTLFSSRPSTSSQPRARSPSRTSPSERNASVPISPIPPTTNPRGELIFSSRVDRSFRDSYDRYRAAFERKRDERERAAAMKTWSGWLWFKLPWNKWSPAPHLASAGTPSRTASNSTRGRGTGSAVPTPNVSRRSSPMPRPRNITPPIRGSAAEKAAIEGSALN
ncbi:hypothetical protein BJ138DRAFT_996917 [Hygrophoropsis aurantiaca]|uniref:Uncharacterized protein n=1 Tax=Hygrophoropsis aurantiaca TaxID=72124 RepID=A0ACB8AQV4_9AGAM|nr:hypothetical protein BJ138DRAFT_996917 [Hygrophoropsis aurantiaca]